MWGRPWSVLADATEVQCYGPTSVSAVGVVSGSPPGGHTWVPPAEKRAHPRYCGGVYGANSTKGKHFLRKGPSYFGPFVDFVSADEIEAA